MKRRRRTGLAFILFVLGIVCVAFVTVHKPGGRSGDKGEETMVGWLIDKVAKGEVELADEGSVRRVIGEGERELGVSLTEETKAGIVGFMQTLDSIEAGTEDFMEQAGEMYQKYSAEFVQEANTAINKAVGSVVEDAAENLWRSIKQSVRDLFQNLTSP